MFETGIVFLCQKIPSITTRFANLEDCCLTEFKHNTLNIYLIIIMKYTFNSEAVYSSISEEVAI